jgi:tetratricopeptide (TPR) repeat protein
VTCDRLEQVTYSSASVVTELSGFLCWHVDARGAEGRAAFERLGLKAASLPAQLFLTPEGALADALEVQFWSPQELVPEIRRIQRGEGTIQRLAERVAAEPADLDARLQLALKHKVGGAKAACEAELAEIRRQDPEGRSRASRHVALIDASLPLYDRFDDRPLREFLAGETDSALLFLGWNRLASYQFFYRARKLEDQSDAAGARRFRESGLEAYRRAWPHRVAARPRDVVEFGNHFAWALWTERDTISESDKVLGLEVAQAARDLAGDDTDVIDTYGCLLFLAGRRDEAIACLERCYELEPLRPEWEERRRDFGLPAVKAAANAPTGRDE